MHLVFITSYFPWLTILVVLPIFAGSSIFFLPHKGNKVFRWYTICICLLELLLTTYVFCYHFQLDDPLIQLEEDFKWINIFDFHWRLGINGLSIGPILLTGFITTLVTLAAWPVTRNSRLFYFLMLAMYSGQIGLFSSQDLLLFFIMWELEFKFIVFCPNRLEEEVGKGKNIMIVLFFVTINRNIENRIF